MGSLLSAQALVLVGMGVLLGCLCLCCFGLLRLHFAPDLQTTSSQVKNGSRMVADVSGRQGSGRRLVAACDAQPPAAAAIPTGPLCCPLPAKAATAQNAPSTRTNCLCCPIRGASGTNRIRCPCRRAGSPPHLAVDRVLLAVRHRLELGPPRLPVARCVLLGCGLQFGAHNGENCICQTACSANEPARSHSAAAKQLHPIAQYVHTCVNAMA